ncbi:hypothetical protein [Algoriphagus namhaensis]
MRKGHLLLFLIFVFACDRRQPHDDSKKYEKLDALVVELESDARVINSYIASATDFAEELLAKGQISPELKNRYTMVDGVSTNRPGDGTDLSTLFISRRTPSYERALDEIAITNPLDSVFKAIKNSSTAVSQVYTNSVTQVSRLYPAFDALSLLEPDLDLTSFNFYYEADAEKNPERQARWIPDPYIDPAGRGWIISLISPVYVEDSLHMVLGIDFQINELLNFTMDEFEEDFLLVTGNGDLVAGSPKAINSLGFPPLKNHIYRETIKEDNFRISDYNLYNSKSPEVRKMAQELLLSSKDHFYFEKEAEIRCALVSRFSIVDWVLIEIISQP